MGAGGNAAGDLAQLNAAIAKAIAAPAFRQKLEAMGTSPDTIGNSPEQMAASVAGYIEKLPRVVQAAGLKAE